MHDYCIGMKLTSEACLLLLWFKLLKHFIQYALKCSDRECPFFFFKY